MSRTCSYFSSNAWERRLDQYIHQFWEIEHFFRESDVHEVSDSINEIANDLNDIDADTVARLPVGQVIERVDTEKYNLEREFIREIWREQADLPQECPYEVHETSDQFCVCHMSPSERRAVGLTSDDVLAWIQSKLDSSVVEKEAYSFVGARFRRLDFSAEIITTDDNYPIDFRYAQITDEFDCQDAVFDQVIRFKGAQFACQADSDAESGDLKYGDHFVDFDANIDFTRSEFRKKVDFKFVLFGSDASFNNAAFGPGMFNYGLFRGRADFMAATFEGKADFSKAQFEQAAILNADYKSAAIYNYTTFSNDVAIWTTTFQEKAEFWATSFQGNLNARYAEFHGQVRFEEVTFEGEVTFDHANFEENVHFRDVSSESIISLRDTVLTSGLIRLPANRPPFYDLRRAVVGDIDLRCDDGLTDDLFEYFYVQKTEFSDFDFTEYSANLRPHWNLHTNDIDGTPIELDADPATLEATYLKAKKGANEVGHNKAASEFFFHEMRFRKQQHAQRAHESLSEIFAEPYQSIREGIFSGTRWVSNATLGFIAGYGERPRNVIYSSLFVILVFAVGYKFLDAANVYAGVIGEEYILLSFQSFITFILGQTPDQATFWFEFFTALQGFIGAFLIALLVFTLTRSIHR